VIENTFNEKNSVFNFPFRILTHRVSLPTKYPAQVLITVPKRNFKLAVDRNLIRRRIKEAYRQHKHQLYAHLEKENIQLAIIIIYVGKAELSYAEIEKKLILSLSKIINQSDSQS